MKMFLYFILFFIAHSIFTSYSFWVTRNTNTLTVLGMQFSGIWGFWVASVIIAAPILLAANLFFSSGFYYGYEEYKRIWVLLLVSIFAQTASYPAMSYIWFRELPQKGALIGALICFAGVMVANFWKD